VHSMPAWLERVTPSVKYVRNEAQAIADGTSPNHDLGWAYRHGTRVGATPRHKCEHASISYKTKHVFGKSPDNAGAASEISASSAHYYLQGRTSNNRSMGGKGRAVGDGPQESPSPRPHNRRSTN